METAMQELIEKLEQMVEHGGDMDLFPAIEHAKVFLEKEKQQIIDAHKASNFYSNLEKTNEALINADAEKYYLETFINS